MCTWYIRTSLPQVNVRAAVPFQGQFAPRPNAMLACMALVNFSNLALRAAPPLNSLDPLLRRAAWWAAAQRR